MNASIVQLKVVADFIYILLKNTTMKIHIKQDSNSLIFNSLFPFYSMPPNKIA